MSRLARCLPFVSSMRKLKLAALAIFATGLILPAHAQTFSVIHNFTGGADGAFPIAGLTADARGNLYGTANEGGRGTCPPENNGCGVVFKMMPSGSGWIFTPIYSFLGSPDGGGPYGRVIFGPNGTLYGVTVEGGSTTCLSGCGTVYNLRPLPTPCLTALCPWQETVLYSFQGAPNAYYPTGDVAFDSSGSLYGTTYRGGTNDGPGTVYKLTSSGQGWSESVIYSFSGGADGGNPYGGVVIDASGNLYGTSGAGGTNGNGAAWELSPSGNTWIEHTLHDFQGASDGGAPYAGLLLSGGALFGTTELGPNNAGTAFELTPSGGSWTFNTMIGLPTGFGPFGKLVADSAGNLYGATQGGSNDFGAVFKLTPSGSGWTVTVLHSFTGGNDGNTPEGSLLVDANDNVYGTTYQGGTFGKGVVFKIAP